MLRKVRSQWAGERALFHALPRNAKILLATSTLYVFASPVFSIFVAAYIMRNSQDVAKVMTFQLATYTAVPLVFYLNGFLLRRLPASALYALGLLLSGVALFAITSLPVLSLPAIIGAGLMLGAATGFHWANRNLLSLACTHDGFRNYYFGIESFFSCVSFVAMPTAVGLFITACGNGASDGANMAYRAIAGVVLALALSASYVVSRGAFNLPPAPMRVRMRFDRVWCQLLLLAGLKGAVQVFQSALPAMLIMRQLGGRENTLGMIQSAGALAAAALMYVTGRNMKPRHRLGVYATALLLYAFGAGLNTVFFNTVSVLVLLVCLLVSQPLAELAFSPIQLQVLDRAVARDPESGYAHLCAFEVALYVGRVLGSGAFILVAQAFSGDTALRYVLSVLALIQLFSLPLARAVVANLRSVDFGIEGPA